MTTTEKDASPSDIAELVKLMTRFLSAAQLAHVREQWEAIRARRMF